MATQTTTRTALSHGTKDEALHFLREHMSGVLATTSADGRPHATVIYYSVDPLLNVTFLTKRRTRKAENLRQHKYAELVVYDEVSQTMVEVAGRVIELTSKAELSQVFRSTLRASLHTAASAIPPISKLDAQEYVAYRLRSTTVRMAQFKRRSSQQPAGLFEIIQC